MTALPRQLKTVEKKNYLIAEPVSEADEHVRITAANMFKSVIRRQLLRQSTCSITTKRFAHAPVAFNWQDPLDSASLFTEEELAIQETAKAYCQERMLPRVLGEANVPFWPRVVLL